MSEPPQRAGRTSGGAAAEDLRPFLNALVAGEISSREPRGKIISISPKERVEVGWNR